MSETNGIAFYFIEGELPDSGASAPEESDDPGLEPGRRRRAPAPARQTAEHTPRPEEMVAESEEKAREPDEKEQACCTEAFSLWEPSAGNTAAGLYTSALAMLATGVALAESDRTGWKVCLGLMGVFLLAAGVATTFSFRYKRREAREEKERQRDAADSV